VVLPLEGVDQNKDNVFAALDKISVAEGDTKPWAMTPRTLKLGTKPLEEGPPCVEKDAEHLTSFEHH